MKILLSIGAVFLGIVILGLALPAIVPGCTCGLPETKCHGCGELIGNALSNFSETCLILGAMGFVFVLWFGIPLLVVGLIVRGIYGIARKKTSD